MDSFESDSSDSSDSDSDFEEEEEKETDYKKLSTIDKNEPFAERTPERIVIFSILYHARFVE